MSRLMENLMSLKMVGILVKMIECSLVNWRVIFVKSWEEKCKQMEDFDREPLAGRFKGQFRVSLMISILLR